LDAVDQVLAVPIKDPPPEPMWVSAADVDVGYMGRAPARQPGASPATVDSLSAVLIAPDDYDETGA